MASPYTLRNIQSFTVTPAGGGDYTVTGITEVTISDSTGIFTAASDNDASKRKYPQPNECTISVKGENPVSLQQLKNQRQLTVVCSWNNLDTGDDITTTVTGVGFKQVGVGERYGDQVLFDIGGEGGDVSHAAVS